MQCFCCLDLLITWDIYGYLDILGSWSKWLAWISLAWLNMLNWHKCPVFKAIWMASHCFDGVRCQLQRKAFFPLPNLTALWCHMKRRTESELFVLWCSFWFEHSSSNTPRCQATVGRRCWALSFRHGPVQSQGGQHLNNDATTVVSFCRCCSDL